jgi:hypothetical protein
MAAALATGRTSRSVLEMLTEAETEAVVRYMLDNAATTKVVHLSPAFGESWTGFPERKIDCIKKVREITGSGLKEAKDFCEGHGHLTITGSMDVKLKSILGVSAVREGRSQMVAPQRYWS